jgi:hypothetical protein
MTETVLLYLFAFAVLGVVLIFGLAFLISPGGVAARVRRLGIYTPVLDLANSRSGRVQLRIMGLILVIGSVAVFVAFISSALQSR